LKDDDDDDDDDDKSNGIMHLRENFLFSCKDKPQYFEVDRISLTEAEEEEKPYTEFRERPRESSVIKQEPAFGLVSSKERPESSELKSQNATNHIVPDRTKNRKAFFKNSSQRIFLSPSTTTSRMTHTPSVTFDGPEELFQEVERTSPPGKKKIRSRAVSFPPEVAILA
jgi:hypothetical protein